MLHIKEAIVVEGKFDKERLRAVTDAPIICTHGFALYRSKRLLASIRELANSRGVIILTDSDRAGFRIRSYLKRCLGRNANVKNAYIPRVEGKERRKESPGKDGLLGVEGMSEAVLCRTLQQVTAVEVREGRRGGITKADFYRAGLSGAAQSAQNREVLARRLSLPRGLSANALLEMVNTLCGEAEFWQMAEQLFGKTKKDEKKPANS